MHSHARALPHAEQDILGRPAGAGLTLSPASSDGQCLTMCLKPAANSTNSLQRSCSSLATEPLQQGTSVGQEEEDMHCEEQGAEEERKERDILQAEQTRSSLNSKTTVLATQYY